MSIAKPVFRVVNAHGLVWAVRFTSEDAAWSRLLGLRGMTDQPLTRKLMREAGWKVRELETAP